MTADFVINTFPEVIAQFGIPKTITTDGAKWFTGFEFQTYCKNVGIRSFNMGIFSPRIEWIAESVAKTVNNFFKKCSTSQSELHTF